MAKELKDKMLEFRGKNNLSQEKLAEMCQVTVQTICNIENGVQTPSKLTLAKILCVIEKEVE